MTQCMQLGMVTVNVVSGCGVPCVPVDPCEDRCHACWPDQLWTGADLIALREAYARGENPYDDQHGGLLLIHTDSR
jgi:hypothetical protein